MSSPKAATAKTVPRRNAGSPKPAAKSAGKNGAGDAAAAAAAQGTTAAAREGCSAEAKRLAADIERAIVAGNLDVLEPAALQALMAALCRLYGMQVEAGRDFLPLEGRNSVSPTEVMTTTSALLKAANLAVFELGMWQSWTGR